MPTDRVWTIKGVRDETRAAVREAARQAGLSLGAWVDRALAEAARRELNPPAAPPAEVAAPAAEAAPHDDVAQVVRDILAQQRRGEASAGPSPVEAMRARMRRRRHGLP